MHEADSNAVVVLVGNSSTHLENASIRTMCIWSQRAYVIQVDHLEWIVRGTGEGVSLDLDLKAAHHLAAWALPNERADHPVGSFSLSLHLA